MATSESSAVAALGPAEWMRELKRLVTAIVDEDDVCVGNLEAAQRILAAITEMRLAGTAGARCVSAKRPLSAPAVDNQKRNEERTEDTPPTSAQVPDCFICPISLDLMRDPVVVASGQTYERAFIQDWLNYGKSTCGESTCPVTRQVLCDTNLVPNHLVRNMISKWCIEYGVTVPPLEDGLEEVLITRKEQNQLDNLLVNLFLPSISEKKQAVKQLRLLTKHNRSARAIIGEKPNVLAQLLSFLSEPVLNNDPEVQKDTVTTIFNISLHEENKKIVGDSAEAIPLLIAALNGATMVVRANAAAALFTLSALDSNKLKIGELGALKPLSELFEYGSPAAKKDAVSALFNLCLVHENRARAVREGVVGVVLRAINNQSLVDESLSLLAILSADRDAVGEIAEAGGTACLLDILRDNSCARNKENAVAVLYSISLYDSRKLREVGQEENASGCISKIVESGTSRARRKATKILQRCERTVQGAHCC